MSDENFSSSFPCRGVGIGKTSATVTGGKINIKESQEEE
jgi:hypothetical protein